MQINFNDSPLLIPKENLATDLKKETKNFKNKSVKIRKICGKKIKLVRLRTFI